MSGDYSLALAIITLETIADGRVGPEPEGHYRAHREAVRIARDALAAIRSARLDLTFEPQHQPQGEGS